jgi:hypothetical protein
MSLRRSLSFLFFSILICTAHAGLEEKLRNGDIVFIRSKSGQSKALEEVTASVWTHMGIALKVKNYPQNTELVDSTEEGVWVVAHSGGPVRLDPLNVFLASGTRSSVKRLRDGINFEKAQKLFKVAKVYADQRVAYDVYFTKAAGYCSGYVDLVFEKALGVDLAAPIQINQLKLDGPEAKKIMSQRFSEKARAPFSVEAWKKKSTVTPVSIYDSPSLITP